MSKPYTSNDFKYISASEEGQVITIEFCREECLNALHPPAWEEISSVFDVFESDPNVCTGRNCMQIKTRRLCCFCFSFADYWKRKVVQCGHGSKVVPRESLEE
jgi:hypothetical protein